MSTEIDIVFALLHSALDGPAPEIEPLDASRWWNLFRLLQKNHVAALCFDAVAKAGAPRDVLMPWLSEHEKAVAWHRYQRKIQQDIVDAMAQHGIETLVLKGTHTAQYYPRPDEREFGDLDLYFYDKHDEADRVAREVLHVEVSNDAHHHSKYNYRGVTIESHYDFLNSHYPPSNRRYETMLKELISTSDSHSSFITHHSSFEVLFLLRHMACHFAASRITLRDLVDWTLTCQALHDKVDWDKVNSVVKDFGMTEFVSVLNTIAEQRLGHSVTLPLSHFTAQGLKDSRTQSLFEHDLLYGSGRDHSTDGLARLGWKLRRWRTNAWKRRMVYSDSEASLLLASLTSHAEKPHSILHKM